MSAKTDRADKIEKGAADKAGVIEQLDKSDKSEKDKGEKSDKPGGKSEKADRAVSGKKGGVSDRDRAVDSPGPDQTQTKVLLAEDDESFVDALVIGLTREGFDLRVARDGNEALRLFAQEEPDLVLLDLMLPRLSGIDVCRSIRAQSSVPIIMVTAKGTEIDTVVGLEVGADDYVAKPYRLRELVARMRAVLRRTPGGDSAKGAEHADGPAGDPGWRANERRPDSSVLEAGGIQIDPDRHLVFIRGQDVHLRRKEFELLSLLMENAGRLLTRDVLIDRVWGSDYFGDTKTLDVHIKRLRTHVEEDPSSPKLITTIRGVGYRFDAPRA